MRAVAMLGEFAPAKPLAWTDAVTELVVLVVVLLLTAQWLLVRRRRRLHRRPQLLLRERKAGVRTVVESRQRHET